MKGKFFKLGLTGWPLGHSFSPAIHKAALAAADLSGSYDLYPAAPLPEGEQALGALLGRMRQGEIDGLNVTIPHKQAVIAYVDALSPAAEAAGAVNTLTMKNGKLTGENTDAAGFSRDLEAKFHLAPGTALILGAGGSARAVVYALVSAGWSVRLAARREAQARELAAWFSPLAEQHHTRLDTAGLSAQALSAAGESWDLIVNTTPLGMHPNIGISPFPLPMEDFRGTAVYDLIYNPIETEFVQQAKACGCPAVGGLGMLVEQAALAFNLWTGAEAQRDAIYASIQEGIN